MLVFVFKLNDPLHDDPQLLKKKLIYAPYS